MIIQRNHSANDQLQSKGGLSSTVNTRYCDSEDDGKATYFGQRNWLRKSQYAGTFHPEADRAFSGETLVDMKSSRLKLLSQSTICSLIENRTGLRSTFSLAVLLTTTTIVRRLYCSAELRLRVNTDVVDCLHWASVWVKQVTEKRSLGGERPRPSVRPQERAGFACSKRAKKVIAKSGRALQYH